MRRNFHALTHKNFRYYWLGQCISLIGTWMQSIGQSWLVLTLTGSPLLLGILGACQFLPIMIFSLFAGILIDRFPKKKILLITQVISMMLAFSLSILVFTHEARFWNVLILAIILGCTNTIDMPTRQSFFVEVVGREDLMNAIALNSAVFNLARMIGPAIAALFMAWFGIGWCFFINGVSFIAVIYGILKIQVKPYVREKKKQNNIFKEIKEGLEYIVNNPKIFETILLILVLGIFAFNYNVLIPVFTKIVLHQNEGIYGMLMSALGLGSLIGAVMVSVKGKNKPMHKTMFNASILIAIMLILNGFSNAFYITAAILFFTGIFNLNFSTRANSTLQLTSKDEFRGRVMSVYSLVFAGSAPIGNLSSGFIADRFGVKTAFWLSGISIFVLAIAILILFKIKYSREETKKTI